MASDPNSNRNSKNQKLLEEAITEMSHLNKDFETKFFESKNLFEKFQTRLMGYIEKQCSKEIQWLNSNAQNQNSKEFQDKIKQFEDCARKNDFGSRDFLMDIQTEEEKASNEDEKCLKSCEAMNTDEEIKICYKNCNKASMDYYNKMNENVISKITEWNNKF
jgi:hypothetical protein